MHKVVIADTSCLILFSKIELIYILHLLYSDVIVTPEVANEFGEPLPQWINIQSAKPENIFLFEHNNLDMGEITSLALAVELKNSTVIFDDNKAKKIAKLHNLGVTGSLGIIVKAREKNIIPVVKDVLTKIKATNFHLPSSLEDLILKIAGEQK
jgi:predicted nucleic acid-binding protein